MKFWQYTVVFQEVPNEISLAFEITNCPYKCQDCHSPHLQTDIGQELTIDGFKKITNKYFMLATNVIFMGGEQYEELRCFLDCAREIGFKTTLYTGACDVKDELKASLNYLKIGSYIPALGGLDKSTTNQRLINLATGKIIPMGQKYIT